MRAKLVALIGALALAGSLLSAPALADDGRDGSGADASAAKAPAAGTRWMPSTGGFFNDPWGTSESKFRIEREIVDAIKHARKGSYIRIAVYSFDRVNVAKALLAAHKRGVRVQVLHNDHQYTTAMKLLKRGLGTNRKKRSWDYTCKTGCRSNQGVLHDKIYLFEHTGGARNVVMTGSANLTGNAAIHQFNDLLVKADVPDLYGVMMDLFEQLKKDKLAKPLFEHHELRDYQLWVMPHPKTTSKNDPIMEILRPVECRGANDGTGTAGRTKIRVSMHAWNGDRGVYIARRLRHLYAAGCDVKVLWALAGSGMKEVLGMNTARGQVPRRGNGYDYDCDELHEIDMYSHQKYLTISGHYGRDRSASYVYTGSSNWTHSGISGDEMILRVRGANLVKRWNSNFEFIWTKRSRPVGTNSGSGGFYPLSTCPEDGDAPRTAAGARTAAPSQLRFSGPHWESD